MAASSVQISSTGGTRLATFSYTEGGVVVHDEKIIHGEQYLPSYSVSDVIGGTSIATVDDHTFELMAGSSLNVYVRRIRIYQSVLATTAAMAQFQIIRLTTAGTGGTARTPVPHRPASPNSGATSMRLPSSKGTEAGTGRLWTGTALLAQTAPTAGASTLLLDLDLDALRTEPFVIPAGTANGLCFKNITAHAGASIHWNVTFTEASF